MDKYREIKRNQIYRMANRGCGIQLNQVAGCIFSSDSNKYNFSSEYLSVRYSPDRLRITPGMFSDELSLYEHPILFKEAHPDYNITDRMGILNTLSTIYQMIDNNGQVIKYIFYLYLFGYTGSEESVIISSIMLSMQPYTVNAGLELNVVTHKNNIGEALKIAKPVIDIGNDRGSFKTEINHVPVSTLTVSPSRNVLTPVRYRLASNETINQITTRLKNDVNVFPDICINDPLVVENGWKRGDIIEFERSDGYIAYRRVTNNRIVIIDIH